SPSFRRDPFARDVLLDPGRTALPGMTALLVLRSTMSTVSAPAISPFRGSITHPTQPLCTLRVRHYCRLTQHSLPGGPLGLTWVGLAPTDRASFAGAFAHPGYEPRHRLTATSGVAVRRLEGWPLARSRLWPSFETR